MNLYSFLLQVLDHRKNLSVGRMCWLRTHQKVYFLLRFLHCFDRHFSGSEVINGVEFCTTYSLENYQTEKHCHTVSFPTEWWRVNMWVSIGQTVKSLILLLICSCHCQHSRQTLKNGFISVDSLYLRPSRGMDIWAFI